MRAVSSRAFARGFAPRVHRRAAVCAAAPVNAQQKPVRLPKGFRDVVDLTHPFSPALPVYPGYKPMQIRGDFRPQDGFAANEVTFDEHTGTHVDAPSHFVAGAVSADRLPVDRLIAPLVVVRLPIARPKTPIRLCRSNDILAVGEAPRAHSGRCARGDAPGWDARIDNADRFLNRDAKGTMHVPGFSERRRAFSSASATSAVWASTR